MDNLIYIVSNKLDYQLLICADAGPAYARNLGWKHDTVDNVQLYLNQGIVVVIDTRLYEDEYQYLHRIIRENPDTPFIAAVTDPYYEECIDKPLYQFLFKTTTYSNVRYLTQYQPTEIIAFLGNTKGDSSMTVLPYPYLASKEVDQAFANRKSKIIFSGSISATLYPERYQFWRTYTRSVWRLKIDTLPHPGYPGTGQAFMHRLVGDDYIRHLSKYKFMFIGASRCKLEFMKYSECAYAGCVPVGYSPRSFDERLRKYVIPIDNRHLSKSLLRLFSMPLGELKEMAAGYRKEFAIQRDPVLLNKQFQLFIKQQCALHTSPSSIL